MATTRTLATAALTALAVGLGVFVIAVPIMLGASLAGMLIGCGLVGLVLAATAVFGIALASAGRR